MINKLINNIEYSSTFFISVLFFYINAYEAIGHCCKVFFWDRFWLDNAVLYVILFLATLLFVLSWLYTKKKKGFIIPVLLILFVMTSFVSNPDLGEYIREISITFLLCCIAFIAFRYANFKLLLKQLDKQKWFFFFLFVVSLFALRNETYQDSALQVIAYNAASVVLLFLVSFVTNRKALSRFFDVIGLSFCAFFVLQLGSRGALVSFIACGVLLLVSLSKRNIAVLATLIALLAVVLANINSIISFTSNVLTAINPSNRLALFFSQEDFFSQAGRTPIYSLFQKASEDGGLLFGKGVCSDRLLMLNSLGYATYFHNIFYEIIYQFGWIIGLPLLVALFALYFGKLFSKQTSREVKMIICILSVRGLLCLLFSGSYLTTFEFFGIVAIITVINKRQAIERSDLNGYCPRSTTISVY